MRFVNRSMAFVAMSTLVVSLAACSKPSSPPTQPSAGPAASDPHDHADHDHSPAEMEKVKTELAKLSPEDAAAAERQHDCPVSGEMLGTMGPPKKVDVNGQPVWICCESCRGELTSNPDKYLAKLKKE